jgi:hypothetical protein
VHYDVGSSVQQDFDIGVLGVWALLVIGHGHKLQLVLATMW